MQLIFQNDHVVINLVGVLFGGCYRRSYFELCVCARGQWKVRILRIGEHVSRAFNIHFLYTKIALSTLTTKYFSVFISYKSD